jgi:hypothetical protein
VIFLADAVARASNVADEFVCCRLAAAWPASLFKIPGAATRSRACATSSESYDSKGEMQDREMRNRGSCAKQCAEKMKSSGQSATKVVAKSIRFLAENGSDPLPGNSALVKEMLIKDIQAWGEYVRLAKIEQLG